MSIPVTKMHLKEQCWATYQRSISGSLLPGVILRKRMSLRKSEPPLTDPIPTGYLTLLYEILFGEENLFAERLVAVMTFFILIQIITLII